MNKSHAVNGKSLDKSGIKKTSFAGQRLQHEAFLLPEEPG
jgi:hypothetical protein